MQPSGTVLRHRYFLPSCLISFRLTLALCRPFCNLAPARKACESPGPEITLKTEWLSPSKRYRNGRWDFELTDGFQLYSHWATSAFEPFLVTRLSNFITLLILSVHLCCVSAYWYHNLSEIMTLVLPSSMNLKTGGLTLYPQHLKLLNVKQKVEKGMITPGFTVVEHLPAEFYLETESRRVSLDNWI